MEIAIGMYSFYSKEKRDMPEQKSNKYTTLEIVSGERKES